MDTRVSPATLGDATTPTEISLS